MPVYEDICEEHGRFEVAKRMSERLNVDCPTCKKRATLVPSVFQATYGWRLTEDSHLPYHKDRIEKNL